MGLLKVQMRSQEPLKDFLCLQSDPLWLGASATEQAREHSVAGDNQAAEVTIIDPPIHVFVVPVEQKVGLFTVVVRISDEAEKSLAELCMCQPVQTPEVEDIEG